MMRKQLVDLFVFKRVSVWVGAWAGAWRVGEVTMVIIVIIVLCIAELPDWPIALLVTSYSDSLLEAEL